MPEIKTLIVTLLDILLLVGITVFCWRGYRARDFWPRGVVLLMFRLLAGKGFWVQLFTLGPLTMLWMAVCRMVSGYGWHATAAGGIVLGFTLALDAMRMVEEDQKAQRSRGQSDTKSSAAINDKPQTRNEHE